MSRGPKHGYIKADDNSVHAQKSVSLWFRFSFCGLRTELKNTKAVGVFRPLGTHSRCGSCVCEIKNEHRRGAQA